jgi:hypothetical protein
VNVNAPPPRRGIIWQAKTFTVSPKASRTKMRLSISASLLLAALVAAGGAWQLSPAAAATSTSLASPAPTLSAEWSAQKKKRKKTTKKTARTQPQYVPFPNQPMRRWRGADPSFGPDGKPYQPPFTNRCMRDLGYGRWESCDVDM